MKSILFVWFPKSIFFCKSSSSPFLLQILSSNGTRSCDSALSNSGSSRKSSEDSFMNFKMFGLSKALAEKQQAKIEMKDEVIRIWLTGKETNIRLLLSTLHHVLWSNSNWQAIPLANLRDGSQVKKAYQKARLCLQPDKLQQRGGTSPLQKSVAGRVFSILQEAWAVYVTNEGLSS